MTVRYPSNSSINGLISVLLPVYNAETTISEALDSILNQTYKKLEVICINDGSTDNSLSILSRYAAIDDRITVVSRENKGLIATLNEAIELSNGEFLARMDSDDISRLDRFDKQVKHLLEHKDVVACGSAIAQFNECGHIGNSYKHTCHDILMFKSLRTVPLWHPTAMIRAQIIHQHSIRYDENYLHAEDVKFWFDLSKVGRLSNLPEITLDYRRSSSQISSKYKNQQRKSATKVRHQIYRYLCNEYSIDLSGRSEAITNRLPNDKDAIYVFLRFLATQVVDVSRLKKISLIFYAPLSLSKKIKLSKYALSNNKTIKFDG